MRILQLSPQVPYPLLDGGKVGIYNITKHLAMRGHEISFCALDRGPAVEDNPMNNFCTVVTIPHSNRNSWAGALRNLFSRVPYNVSKYRSSSYLQTLESLLEEREFDVVHVDHLHMAYYGLVCKSRKGLPIVLREHNVESTIMERFAATVSSRLLRLYANIQLSRIRTYEGTMAKQYDLCCVITEDDRHRLEALEPTVRASVVPGGVQSAYFTDKRPVEEISNSIVFFGGMDWIPNQDAIRWFLDDVFPLILKSIPSAQVFIVGKSVPPDIVARQSKSIVFRGFVPDLKKEVQKYSLAIAPFRIGGGMRLKILESFAMRIPVVSTSIGCEGIEAVPGRHLLVGNSAEEFAFHVVHVLADRACAVSLTESAFKLASEKYRWEIVAEMLENCYSEAVKSASRRVP